MNKDEIVYDLTEQWDELIQTGQICDGEETLFEPKPFARCMRETFNYFFCDTKRKKTLTMPQVGLYGYIFAYAKLPVMYDNENCEEFEKSQFAAKALACAVAGRKEEIVSGTSLKQTFYDGESFIEYKYDVTTDDMGEFKELTQEEFLAEMD